MSWKMVTLDDLAEKIDYGLTASALDSQKGSRFLRITDLQNDSVDWKTVPSCVCSKKDIEQYRLQKGDIVFARTGATTGKSYLLNEMPEDTVFASYLIRVRPNEKVDAQFLSFFFKSPKYWQQVNLMANGVAQPGVNSSKLKELKIPLPPLPEQKRIATILDKADNLRRKRQQAMQLADEFLRAVFLDMFGDPVTNPKGWDVKPLSSLVSKLGDGLHGTPEYTDNGEYFFINGNNLNNGKIETNDNVKKVNKTEFEKYKKDLNENTMFVSINGTIGKVAYYRGEKIILGKSACYFNIIPECVSDVYLFYLIQSNYFLHYVESVFTGSTIKNVSLKSMREFPVPLPPRDIQENFVNKVKVIEKMKARVCYSLVEQQNLFNSLSQKAFAGEL